MCISHGDWQLHHCQLSDGFKRIWVFSYMYWASESAIHSKFRIFVSGTKRGILTLPGRWKGLAKDSQLMPDLFLRLPFFFVCKRKSSWTAVWLQNQLIAVITVWPFDAQVISILFLPTISALKHTLSSWEWRKLSRTQRISSLLSNSSCKYHRKLIWN